jgi:two-component system, OmpR family, response regulator MtrA
VAVTDGESALELALERTPDLVVLDVAMPRLDGYEVIRRLREHDGTRPVPVILLTARVLDSDVRRATAAGADDYVTKPFSPLELGRRVQAALGR